MDIIYGNKNYFNTNTTYYVTDSTVIFSFQKVGEMALLFSFCNGNAVITPKIEEEISRSDTSGLSGCLDLTFSSTLDPWLRTPKNNFLTLTTSSTGIFDNHIFTTGLLQQNYKEYFYLANVNYYSITSNINAPTGQYDFSKLKSEADREISRWVILNSSSILLTNDQLIRKFLKEIGIEVFGAIGVLLRAIKNGSILFEKADDIYNKWIKIDPGSCKWVNKKLINFKDIYLNFNLENKNHGRC